MILAVAGSVATSSFFFADRNQDSPGTRIVHSVPCTASEWDGGHESVRRRIDHGVSISVLVGYEDTLRARGIRDAVRIFDGSGLCDRLQSLHVDNRDFVLSGNRRAYSAQFRNRPHTMKVRKSVEVGNDFALLHGEDDELIRVHVGDVKTALRGLETLIPEPDGGTGQRNIPTFCSGADSGSLTNAQALKTQIRGSVPTPEHDRNRTAVFA